MSDLVPTGDQGFDTGDLLGKILRSTAEGVTGIAASSPSEWFLSLGHLVQQVRSRRFVRTLRDEWNAYCEKGRVMPGYTESEQHQECLLELLDFLDRDMPDETRFTLLKKIFLVAATETVSTRDSVLPQQYLRVCRTLSAGEVLVLTAAYENAVRAAARNEKSRDRGGWIRQVAGLSGLAHAELVETYEEKLVEKKLLFQRRSQSEMFIGPHDRLTDLGYEICKYIEAYEPPTEGE